MWTWWVAPVQIVEVRWSLGVQQVAQQVAMVCILNECSARGVLPTRYLQTSPSCTQVSKVVKMEFNFFSKKEFVGK